MAVGVIVKSLSLKGKSLIVLSGTAISSLRWRGNQDRAEALARANQADRCITLLHCAQRLTPLLLDTRGYDRKTWVLFFVWALRDISTFPVGTWLSALDQSFRSQYNRLLRTSQSHYFVLRGKETNFFGSKFAIDWSQDSLAPFWTDIVSTSPGAEVPGKPCKHHGMVLQCPRAIGGLCSERWSSRSSR